VDVGTDNEALRNDDLYIGEKRPRAKGEEYFSFLQEMIDAIRERYPDALIQFEDFTTAYAYEILKLFKYKQLCFNDDIQGTGAVTLAALLNGNYLFFLKCLKALRSKGLAFNDLRSQKIVMVGGGTAGLGGNFCFF
jgi:malic enzyme